MINERIKELANKTRIGKLVDTWDYDEFAQLIIKECAEVCADRGKMHDGLYSAWAADCAQRIEKHFGV